MRLPFIKCHGSGNEFALFDARALGVAESDWAGIARAVSGRGGPVGTDGILLLVEGSRGAEFGFRMLNSDGSEAETCLNGVRCVARLGFASLGIAAAQVSLPTSRVEVERAPDLADGVYTVTETAGPATLTVDKWPLLVATQPGGRLIEAAVAELESKRRFTAVAIPNPHLIAFVDAVDDDELTRVGQICEAAPAWLPNRANVSFVEVRGDELFVRTHERGVGLTNSCGSAMAASTYAACLAAHAAWGREIVVRNRGGMVRARAEADAMLTLSGNATWEWEGTVDVDAASGRASGLEVTRRFEDEAAAWERVREA